MAVLELVESDKPKATPEWLSQFLARPPQPILRFYKGFEIEKGAEVNYLKFNVRNGLPIPLLYGVYVKVSQNSKVSYLEKTDHIGPFSTDRWRFGYPKGEGEVELRVGLVPFELQTDKAKVMVV